MMRLPHVLLVFISFIALPLSAFDLFWPTPNTAFLEGKSIEHYLQSTVSGNPESGNFGCVRNNGHRFHEGVDLKCLKRNKQQEPLDAIYAAASGKIAYINTVGGNSAFGKYIVIVHDGLEVPFYTLYAHLSHIAPHIKVGQTVTGGTPIATMGRTATKPVAKHLAHLHFEIGIQLSNTFDNWYSKQKFAHPNYHGQWNGMNLVGIDPLDFYQQYLKDKDFSIANYLKTLPTAVTLEIATHKVPDFIKRYPALLTTAIPQNLKGWEIEFTWYGLPKAWTPLTQLAHPHKKITILNYDPKAYDQYKGRKMLTKNKTGHMQLSKKMNDILKLLIG